MIWLLLCGLIAAPILTRVLARWIGGWPDRCDNSNNSDDAFLSIKPSSAWEALSALDQTGVKPLDTDYRAEISLSNGRLELHFSDDPDHFLRLAGWVHNQLNGRWKERLNGMDQSYWDLQIMDTVLTVHREHYLGVSVSGENNEETNAMLLSLKSGFENLPKRGTEVEAPHQFG